MGEARAPRGNLCCAPQAGVCVRGSRCPDWDSQDAEAMDGPLTLSVVINNTFVKNRNKGRYAHWTLTILEHCAKHWINTTVIICHNNLNGSLSTPLLEALRGKTTCPHRCLPASLLFRRHFGFYHLLEVTTICLSPGPPVHNSCSSVVPIMWCYEAGVIYLSASPTGLSSVNISPFSTA